MQCKKIDISVDVDKLKDVLGNYCNNLHTIAAKYPNDIVRVMTNYPAGLGHYTMNKRADENWQIVENDDYILYTMINKFGTRMISVYYKAAESIDMYMQQIVNEIRETEKINPDKNAVMALVYAGPKFRLEKHIDSKGLVRYHVPVIVSKNSYFEIFEPHEKKYFPVPGEVWRLETHLPHAAQNDDEINYRIHCIVDFV